MITDLGMVPPGSTVRIPFHTFDSNDPTASVTTSGFAASDIEIFKDGSTTQRASDSGYTATTDFDGITGTHLLVIDLADNTTAGFWAAGSEYLVQVSSVTVDGATINFWAGRFRIGYEAAHLNTTIASLSSQTSFTLTAGPAEDDALNGSVVLIHDVASAVQKGYAVVSDYTGSTKTVTLVAGTTFTAAATDNIAFYPPVNASHAGSVAYSTTRGLAGTALPNAAADAAGGLPISDAGGLDLDNRMPSSTSVTNMNTVFATDFATAYNTTTDGWNVNTTHAAGTAWNSGAIGANTLATDTITAAKIATDAIGASELASDAVTEIQSGLATGSSLGIVETLVEAIHHALVMSEGQADSGTTTTMVDSALTQANDFWNGNILVFITGNNAGRAAVITDFVAASDAATFSPAMPNAVAASDGYIIMPGNYVWDHLVANHAASGSTGEVISAILTDTAEIGAAGAGLTNINLPNQTMDIVGNITGNLSGSVGSVTGNVGGNVVGSVGSVTGHTPQTGDSYARLGAPAGASISADIAAIEAQTDDIGALGAGLTAIIGADGDTLKTLSDQIDALTTSAGPQVLVDTTIATLSTQTSFTLTAGSADNDAYNGAVAIITDQSTATQKAVATILDYVGSSKTITLASDPAIFTMATGDSIAILANISSAPSAATIRAEIDANSTQLAAIVADTNELQGDWANGGRLDLILDARASQTSVDTIDGIVDSILVDTAEIGAAGAGLTSLASAANLATVAGYLDTEVAAILADTNELQTDLANGGRLDLLIDAIKAKTDNLPTDPADQSAVEAAITSATSGLATAAALATVDTVVDAILVDTDTTIPATLSTIAGYIDTEVAAIKAKTDNLPAAPASSGDVTGVWTTAMTESYASDGATMTPAQALYMLLSAVTEFSIAGTTITCKKLDGSTTAMTFTLNDGTNPTSRTRAS